MSTENGINGNSCNSGDIITASAPGKVILHGEHSVVYGKLALALSLDLRTRLTITPGGNSVTLNLPDVDINHDWPMESIHTLWKRLGREENVQPKPLTDSETAVLRAYLGIKSEGAEERSKEETQSLALLSFLQLYLAILPTPRPMTLVVNSQLPTGAGLGSSAAYAVCLSGALLHMAGHLDQNYFMYENTERALSSHQQANLKSVCEWAYRSEQVVHGTPSGIDNSICTFGGALSFCKGNITPMEVPRLRVLLVNTKVPRKTKMLVAGVRQRKDRHPTVVNPLLESLDALAKEGLSTLNKLSLAKDSTDQEEIYSTLGELIDINHSVLASLGVSHPSLDRLVEIARNHGLHAKLTGAGGGGFGFVVVTPGTPEAAVSACTLELEGLGYQVWNTRLGAPGLSFQQHLSG